MLDLYNQSSENRAWTLRNYPSIDTYCAFVAFMVDSITQLLSVNVHFILLTGVDHEAYPETHLALGVIIEVYDQYIELRGQSSNEFIVQVKVYKF